MSIFTPIMLAKRWTATNLVSNPTQWGDYWEPPAGKAWVIEELRAFFYSVGTAGPNAPRLRIDWQRRIAGVSFATDTIMEMVGLTNGESEEHRRITPGNWTFGTDPETNQEYPLIFTPGSRLAVLVQPGSGGANDTVYADFAAIGYEIEQ